MRSNQDKKKEKKKDTDKVKSKAINGYFLPKPAPAGKESSRQALTPKDGNVVPYTISLKRKSMDQLPQKTSMRGKVKSEKKDKAAMDVDGDEDAAPNEVKEEEEDTDKKKKTKRQRTTGQIETIFEVDEDDDDAFLDAYEDRYHPPAPHGLTLLEPPKKYLLDKTCSKCRESGIKCDQHQVYLPDGERLNPFLSIEFEGLDPDVETLMAGREKTFWEKKSVIKQSVQAWTVEYRTAYQLTRRPGAAGVHA